MIRSFAPLPALAVLLLSACSAGTPATPGNSPADTTAAGTATQCPDSSFEQFLERFSSQISVQETATADPLLSTRVNAEAQPEPALETQSIALADVLWPVMPDLRQARNAGRQVQVSGQDAERTVTVLTPDTSDQQHYHFRQQPCWTLVQQEDLSI